MNTKEKIAAGKTYLGIELGSTRIKAVLIDDTNAAIASGDFAWENQLVNNRWTYSMDLVWAGLQGAFANLSANVTSQYGITLTTVAAMGISGMMHGYLALDREENPLAPFLTWRNTNTGPAAKALTEKLNFNIPLRWSISHLYQAILDQESHVPQIAYLTTLAGYIHLKLTGNHVMGVGEASGMFPIDSAICDFDQARLETFSQLISHRDYPWDVKSVLPKVLCAGENAGVLTAQGAKLLDPTGIFQGVIPMCPPEGDAGTGMVATNAVAQRTGNVSAGTSVFAMVVLEKPLSKVYEEIDMVTTPDGSAVAMVHCNNCTNEINAWATVFRGFLESMGLPVDMNAVYTTMFQSGLAGKADAGGLTLFNYLSGEPITGFELGCPMLVRPPVAQLDFQNFMRAQLYSALAALQIGFDILTAEEVAVDKLLGHGGYFKTPEVGAKILAAVAEAAVSTMETAGEGGPWGVAILAKYMACKAEEQSLGNYLDHAVFDAMDMTTVEPDPADMAGLATFMAQYKQSFPIQQAAVQALHP